MATSQAWKQDSWFLTICKSCLLNTGPIYAFINATLNAVSGGSTVPSGCAQNHLASCKNHQRGEVMFVVTGYIRASIRSKGFYLDT